MRTKCNEKAGFEFLFKCFGNKYNTETLMKKSIFSLLLVFLASSPVLSDVELPGVFGDNMVLQQEMKVPVWGTADPGEKVTVTLDGRSSGTKARKDGKWQVKLKKMKSGGPYEMTITGNNTIIFSNVMIGEVWVCSGQSNMAWTIERVNNIDNEVASANYPEIRMLTVDRVSKEIPQEDFPGRKPQWAVDCM